MAVMVILAATSIHHFSDRVKARSKTSSALRSPSPRDILERVCGLAIEQLLPPINCANQINTLVVRGRDSFPQMDWAWEKKIHFYTLN